MNVPGKATRKDRYVFQILADDIHASPQWAGGTSDHFSLRDLVRLDLISTSCQKGYPSGVGPGPWTIIGSDSDTPNRPAIEIRGPATDVRYSAPFAVNVFGAPPSIIQSSDDVGADPVMSVIDFFRYFLMPQPPQTYGVAVLCCDGADHLIADVEVFPPQEWRGGLSITYSREKAFEADPFKKQGRRARGYLKEIVTNNFKVTSSLSVMYLNKTVSVELPIDKLDYVQKVTKVLGKMRDVEELAGKANQLNGIKGTFEISYPKVKLSGGIKRKETPGKWTVEHAGDLKLELDPLIGVKADVDILDALIAAAGASTGAVALSKIILIAKEAAAKRRICEVSLKLGANLDLAGEFQWSGGFDLTPTEAKFGPCITLTVEGLVASANEFWHVAAGAKFGGESKFGAYATFGKEAHPSFGRRFEWSGISVFYSVFAQRTKGTEYGQKPELGSIGEQIAKKPPSESKDKIQLVDAWFDPPQNPFGPPTMTTASVGAFFQE